MERPAPSVPAFSYEDFLEPQYFWPGQTALEEPGMVRAPTAMMW